MASHDGWYIAEPDGETTGPMSRAELIALFQRNRFSPDALAWHVDLSEWHPLARIASATGGSGTPAPGVAAAKALRAEASSSVLDFGREAAAPPSPLQDKLAKAMEGLGQQPAPPPPTQPKSPAPGTRGRQRAPRTLNAERNDNGKRLLSRGESTSAKAVAAKVAVAAKSDAEKNAEYALQAGRRFLARMLDTATLGLVGAALLWGVLQRLAVDTGSESAVEFTMQAPTLWPLLFLAPLALVPLEIIALSVAGTTPGKALLGLELTRLDGSRPSPFEIVRRTLQVLWRALGLGFPLAVPITLIVAGVKLINNGTTSWDRDLGLRTRSRELSGGQIKAIAIVILGMWILLDSDMLQDLFVKLAALSAQWMMR